MTEQDIINTTDKYNLVVITYINNIIYAVGDKSSIWALKIEVKDIGKNIIMQNIYDYLEKRGNNLYSYEFVKNWDENKYQIIECLILN